MPGACSGNVPLENKPVPIWLLNSKYLLPSAEALHNGLVLGQTWARCERDGWVLLPSHAGLAGGGRAGARSGRSWPQHLLDSGIWVVRDGGEPPPATGLAPLGGLASVREQASVPSSKQQELRVCEVNVFEYCWCYMQDS